jgi:two-component system nitrogen regulation response regulator GlnG
VLLPAFLPDLANKSGHAAPAVPSAAGLVLDEFVRQKLESDAQDLYAEVHRQVDRVLLPLVLDHTGGSQYQAARLLGIARQTLRQKLRDLGLHVTHSVESDEEDRP